MEKVEQTYKLPVGWILVKLEDISKQITDGSHNPPKSVDSGIPMLSAQNIENGKITFDAVRYITKEDFEYENQRTKIEEEDVLLTIVATIGRAAVVSKNIKSVFTLQRSVAVIKPLIKSEFLMYCFQSPLFQKQLTENAKGTAQKGVYLKTLRSLEIPLAPLQEQHRIISKIESLFSELDEVEKGLQKSLQLLEIYRQALLKNAFEGKLTSDLRKDYNFIQGDKFLLRIKKELQKRNNKEHSNWIEDVKRWEKEGKIGKKPNKPIRIKEIKPLNDIELKALSTFKTPFKWVKIGEIATVKGGKRLPPKHSFSNSDTGLVYLMAGNLKNGTVENKLNYINKETYDALRNYKVRTNDVYITIVGANIGESGVIPEKFNSSILTENAAKISFAESVESKYISYWLNSSFAQLRIKSKVYSATLGKLGLGRVETIEIPLCHSIEQKAIVKIIDSQFSLIDQLAQTVNSSLKKNVLIKNSILKNAFEGKLVDSLPTDETVNNLLNRIKIEKEIFLTEQIKIKKIAPKRIKKMEKSMSIEEVLKSSDKPILAKKVWSESKHNEDIAAFYAELKELGDRVIEIREGLDSFLSLKK